MVLIKDYLDISCNIRIIFTRVLIIRYIMNLNINNDLRIRITLLEIKSYI